MKNGWVSGWGECLVFLVLQACFASLVPFLPPPSSHRKGRRET